MAFSPSTPSTYTEEESHGLQNILPKNVVDKSSRPVVVISMKDFENSCKELEQHTLIGYFFGRIPNETLIRKWVQTTWQPLGIKVENIQNLNKGFSLFRFTDPQHVVTLLDKNLWYIPNTLLIFQRWHRNFTFYDNTLTEKSNDNVTRGKKFDIIGENGLSDFVDVNNAAGAQHGSEFGTNEAQTFSLTRKVDLHKEINSILDGLGPRFIDWWGNDPFPVDADLLPQVVPNYKTPLRILPYGIKRSQLSTSDLTNLRKLARPVPVHFALGRNRPLQGLAAAILKLWERSEIAKIAVKRAVQNANTKLMAEELKKLTGGILISRNEYYIIIYRGKDFLPSLVANMLAEKAAEAKVFQDEEEVAQALCEVNIEDHTMRETAAEAKKDEEARRLERKIAISKADVHEDKHALDSNAVLNCTQPYMFTETADEELDYENSDNSDHFYGYSENEERSSSYESEMDEIDSIQNAETGAQALTSKESIKSQRDDASLQEEDIA